ncbi:hypothetical protein BD410DRAFT_639312 [Rickenella mellea]|uniref:Uncharacterized protein n=1 Tax=Rickenella mellea TaxID=50990 RepID=A0A4Y7QCW3_9AGAM|nr:hypothetical protein BD410DRAFT_639312 [Rickenella mellea]
MWGIMVIIFLTGMNETSNWIVLLAFDLCQNCVLQLPEEPDRDCSSHASSHPMIRFRFVVGYILRMRNREKALEIVKTLENASNTAFTCKGPCGKVDVCGIHFRCIQCEDYILCADCISSYESDQVDYHSLSHIFIRFSGEPLIFHPKQEEGTVSDQARMANIEAVLGKFEERLAKQEHVMQSLTEELSAIRMTMEKGFQLKKE